MSFDVEAFKITRSQTVGDAIARIDANGEGLALLLNDKGELDATITDGDIRRALLSGVTLSDPVDKLIQLGKLPPHDQGPITASTRTPANERLRLMTENVMRHLPIIDEAATVVEIVLLRELVEDHEEPLEAVVMAGGFGKRAMPFTADTPKPMLELGNRPLMERTLENLKHSGIRKVNVTLHHLPEKIRDHFGDGAQLGLDINYVNEDTPLGTAGALRLMEGSEGPLLVLNGDILTNVDLKSFVRFHRDSGSSMTVGVRRYDFPVPYGVVHCNGQRVTALVEKPTTNVLVSAGIYLLEPKVVAHIPADGPFDMPELVNALLESGDDISAFLIHEYWLDIGRPDDYEQAQVDIEKGSVGT